MSVKYNLKFEARKQSRNLRAPAHTTSMNPIRSSRVKFRRERKEPKDEWERERHGCGLSGNANERGGEGVEDRDRRQGKKESYLQGLSDNLPCRLHESVSHTCHTVTHVFKRYSEASLGTTLYLCGRRKAFTDEREIESRLHNWIRQRKLSRSRWIGVKGG